MILSKLQNNKMVNIINLCYNTISLALVSICVNLCVSTKHSARMHVCAAFVCVCAFVCVRVFVCIIYVWMKWG